MRFSFSRISFFSWELFLLAGDGLGVAGRFFGGLYFPGGLLLPGLDWHKVPSFHQGMYF